jgi:hypothetical protein
MAANTVFSKAVSSTGIEGAGFRGVESIATDGSKFPARNLQLFVFLLYRDSNRQHKEDAMAKVLSFWNKGWNVGLFTDLALRTRIY